MELPDTPNKTKPEDFLFSAPEWSQLPDLLQTEFSSKGYDQQWYREKADFLLRQTLLNVHSKLVQLGLWDYVAREDSSGKGCLEFLVTDVNRLKSYLKKSPTLSTPKPFGYMKKLRLFFRKWTIKIFKDSKDWQSRERRWRCSLHLKHFGFWENTNKVQAHIDMAGLARPVWWIFPPIPLVLALIHAVDYKGYLDAFRIRNCLKNMNKLEIKKCD